jgi:glyoxylase-like metal-dependent hydrolase (beta-lactamase superfamily II)
MQVFSIDAGLFKLDGGAMFGVVPKVLWQKSIPSDENNLCTFSMRCLLIIDGERKILVDTGMGDKQSDKFFSHYYPSGKRLLDSLKEKNFSPEDITDVILTHLHFDHCGGAVNRDLQPTFPNAIYWTSKEHWEWAIHPNAREKASFLKENLLPLQENGVLKFIDSDKNGKAFFSDRIHLLFVHGHTKSMMLPIIQYKNQILAYMADLIPTAAHIPLPYIMGYDMFPMTTLEEKEKYLNEAVNNNHILFFEHDAIIECCRVIKTEKGFAKGEIVNLENI